MFLCIARSQYFSQLKSRLSLAWRAERSLEETWPSLVRALRKRLDSLRGAASVPSIHFKHIKNNGGNLPAATLDKVGQNTSLVVTSQSPRVHMYILNVSHHFFYHFLS